MARDFALAVADILKAIVRLEEATGQMTLEQFDVDWRAQYVVERGLTIISEASRAIPEELKQQYPEIRWIGVRDIGNVLRHQYASLSTTLLWNVVRDELPRLRIAIMSMMSSTGD
jgi:uncharacterized protein with HEPN domain